MTQTALDDASLGSALAMLWQRHRQTNLDRISLLELTTADVLRSKADDKAVAEAGSAAHKLAGSLGTFGFYAGSRAALEAEYLLREPDIDGRLLAEAVTALRASVQEEGNSTLTMIDEAPSEASTSESAASVTADIAPDPTSATAISVRVVSVDDSLISRLTVEAAAIGLATSSTAEMPAFDTAGADRSIVVVDDGPASPWEHPELLEGVASIARVATVVVLTDRDSFEDRAEFARSGATGVISRSQGMGQTVSFLSEVVAQRRRAPSAILSLNASPGLEDALHRALDGTDCHLDVRGSGAELWDALEEQGASLIVVGYAGSPLSGPELCRVIRAHPRWHHLPVVVMGGRSRTQLDEAFAAGADDYLNIGISSHDLGVRLQHLLSTSRLSEARSDSDPIAGTANRTATERSLDRLLGLAVHNGDPFALALVTIDHFDRIRTNEGTAVSDAVLHLLGSRLVGAFQGENVAGRWTDDGFAVGIHGATREEAFGRVAGILEGIAAEGVSTMSGGQAHYTFSAGIAAAPADGSSLGSLERICETALGRAAVAENSVVVSGERPAHADSDPFDVVLIDDDDSMADVVEYALGLRDYRFKRFSDGADAATALGQGHVKAKVVLLDVGLPSLDGFGVLEVLRSKGILEETRVIMLTARSSEGETLRAISLGATEHITKPFSVPVLLARLDQTHAEVVA